MDLQTITWLNIKESTKTVSYCRAPAARRAAGMEPHRHHGKSKETHEFIFSWLSWLAVLLVGTYDEIQKYSLGL